MADLIDHYEASDLADHHKAALRLADALMTGPGDISDELAADIRRHFTEAQIVEISTDVMKWNYQKVLVALGVDAEVRSGELADLGFDEDGNAVID